MPFYEKGDVSNHYDETGSGFPILFMEVSVYPWKETKDQTAEALRHVHTFLKTHQPVTAAR